MRIRYSGLANLNLRQAWHYILQDNPDNAKAVMERIEKAIGTLCEYPSLGKPGRLRGTREFFVGNAPFIVIYRSAKTELHILSVLHTSRKYPPLPPAS